MVTVYKRADGQQSKSKTDEEVIRSSAFDYNPAVEARFATLKESDMVRSRKWRSDYALGDTQAKIQARM